eukprot:gene24694-31068_t
MNGDREYSMSVPGFRFKRLSRAVHWQRVRGFNIDRVIQNNDTRSLLACLDDVVTGDVSQEDIDPKLHKALQLQQYSAQYLLSCHSLLKGKEKVVHTALRTFDEEERLLDLKIAKMRAREKALEREARECDRMCSDYTALLRDLSPRLVDDLYRTYRTKVSRQCREDEGDAEEEDTPRRREAPRGGQVLTIPHSRSRLNDRREGNDAARVDDENDTWNRRTQHPPSSRQQTASPERDEEHRLKKAVAVAPFSRQYSGQQARNDNQERGKEEEEDSEGGEDRRGSDFKTVRRITGSTTTRSVTAVASKSHQGAPEDKPPLDVKPVAAVDLISPQMSTTEPQASHATQHHLASTVQMSTASAAMSVDSLAPRDDMRTNQHDNRIKAPIHVPVTLLRSVSARDRSSSESDNDINKSSDNDSRHHLKSNSKFNQTFPKHQEALHSNKLSDSESSDEEEKAKQAVTQYAEQSFADQSLSFIDLDAHPKTDPSSAVQRATNNEGSKRNLSDDEEGDSRERKHSQDKYEYKRHSPQLLSRDEEDISSPAPPKKSAAAHHDNTAKDSRSFSSAEMSPQKGEEEDEEEEEEEDLYDDDPFSPYPADNRGGSGTPHTFDSRLGGSSAFSPQPGQRSSSQLDKSMDIDASSSVVIDFAFPNAAFNKKDVKPAGEQLGIRAVSYHDQDGQNRKTGRWDEDSSSQPSSMGTLQLIRQGSSNSPFDDNVLLGTAKQPFNLSRRPLGDTDTLADSDVFDRDSLAGTAPLRPRPSDEPRLSTLSPWGAVNTEHNEQSGNSIEMDGRQSNQYRGSVDSQQSAPSDLATPQWVMGRADMESIELAEAFDVFVSALRLDDLQDSDHHQAVVSLCFLGIESTKSSRVAIGSANIQPLSFSAHMRFNDSTSDLLRTEIAEFEDLLAFQINVTAVDSDGQTTVMLAQAHINLWIMVEDACNILRQEVDILSVVGDEADLQIVGSAVVDEQHQQ